MLCVSLSDEQQYIAAPNQKPNCSMEKLTTLDRAAFDRLSKYSSPRKDECFNPMSSDRFFKIFVFSGLQR